MAVIPGLTPGTYQPAGSAYGHGMSFGTPRDWSQGGQQYYDPQYAQPLMREGGGQGVAMGPMQQSNPYAGSPAGRPFSLNDGRVHTGGGVGGTSPRGLPWQNADPIFGNGFPGGFGNIATSITPRAPYSPQQTLEATNQAVAANHASGNMTDILKRFDSPGISRGTAHAARALPIAAAANQGARRARAQLPMEDFFANAQSILGGQTARDQEANSLMQLALRQQANDQKYRQGYQQQQLQNFGAGFNVVDALFGLN